MIPPLPTTIARQKWGLVALLFPFLLPVNVNDNVFSAGVWCAQF